MNLSDFLDLSERKSCHCEYSDNNDIDWVKMSSSGRFSAFAFVSKCALVFIVVLCSFLSQLLAVFRFLCLQLGYAAFRLRHWWVVAVCQLSPTQTHTHTHCWRESSLIRRLVHRWPLWWPVSSLWWRWSYLTWVVHTFPSHLHAFTLNQSIPLWPLGSTGCFLGCFINRRRSAVTSS